uniref:CCHC-type domain-containing protein n=1 Tax=Tanacetum cinerariifolium TaxID=118510 RepID=A0A699GNX1_TANCI|nr:hypothetical protein [Tanacetum cinerariifolium]
MIYNFGWVSDDEPEAPAEAPPSSDYVLGPKHPPSPDYVSGPEHPPSPDYVPGLEELEQASLFLDYVPEPEYPEYLAPSEAEGPIEDQPLPDDASPTALSPGYVVNSNLEEDPEKDLEEDHVDYPADGGDDDDDESSDNDDDEEEASMDDDEEEEEHLIVADSSTVPVDDHVPLAKDTEAFETDESAPTPLLLRHSLLSMLCSSPPPSLLSLLSSLLPQITSPPLPLPSPPTTSLHMLRHHWATKQSGFRRVQHLLLLDNQYWMLLLWMPPLDICMERTLIRYMFDWRTPKMTKLFREPDSTHCLETDDIISTQLCSWRARLDFVTADTLTTQRMLPIAKIPLKKRISTTTTTTPMTDAQIKTLIAQRVVNALAEVKANRTSRNGNDSHDLGTGSRRTERVALECTNNDFLKCQPLNFKVTKGVIGLTQWQRSDMLEFPRQELICGRMFPEESDQVEKYVEGLPDMIQGSVMDSNPKTMQEAIEIANGSKDLEDLNLCALNETTIMIDSVLPKRLRENQRVLTCFECGDQGHFKSNCPKLKNKNHGNHARNGNAVARAYIVGTPRTNLNSNVVMGVALSGGGDDNDDIAGGSRWWWLRGGVGDWPKSSPEMGRRRKCMKIYIVSQLKLLDEKLSQKDINQKLLRSLSPEWNTHAVVRRNKTNLDTMSMDDLYNNLKVYEPEVKRMSSSSLSIQNMVFVSSLNNNTSSTNRAVNTAQAVNSAQAVNTAHGVSTARTQINAAL